MPVVAALAALLVTLATGTAAALAHRSGARVQTAGAITRDSAPAPGGAPAPAAGVPAPDPAAAGATGGPAADGVSGLGSVAGAGPGAPGASTATAAGPARFALRAPGATLPTGAQCAAWVRAEPTGENKGANRTANQRTGHRIEASGFSTTDVRAVQRIAPRVDGQFTGSTRDILRWAACKWGFDEDFVYAQAAVESWWLSGTFGDWTTNAANCAPGHGLGADGRPGQCPESFGIVQTRYPYMTFGWPGIGQSTAMVADLGYANLRTCFEGYEGWLNGVERGREYGPGDIWGCAGRYMSGRWYTAAGNEYVARVRTYLQQRIWESRDFQQP
jgi:autotransporter family porin